ncbi:MAG: helix-turn-helix transcriptional regulator [Pseudomonadota bacterium]
MDNRTIFAANLRLLTGYRPSISAVCRDLGISRQQFTKYLAGQNLPSVRNLRKISDYFGVEETEILMPVSAFKKVIALNPPRSELSDPLQAFVTGSLRSEANTRTELKKFLGYYYSHFRIAEAPNQIVRSLLCIYESDGAILTKNIERYPNETDGAATTLKYDGVALYNAERLFIYERETTTGTRIWQTVVYANNLTHTTFLSGLTMGIATETIRDIACYRVVYEFLGTKVNNRMALRGCGTFDLDSLEISKFIRDRVSNDIRPNEDAFVPRA